MVILNQEGTLKGQTEPHGHGLVKKLKREVAVSTATSHTLLHMQLMYKILICQRRIMVTYNIPQLCYNLNEDVMICRRNCLCS